MYVEGPQEHNRQILPDSRHQRNLASASTTLHNSDFVYFSEIGGENVRSKLKTSQLWIQDGFQNLRGEQLMWILEQRKALIGQFFEQRKAVIGSLDREPLSLHGAQSSLSGDDTQIQFFHFYNVKFITR